MRIVGQREIADAVEIGLASEGILPHLHVGIAQEHAGTAAAPQEGFLGGIDKRLFGLGPLLLLEIDEAYAELRPLALYVVLETRVGKLLEAHHRTVVVFLLLVLEALHPQVVRIFLAELACILQHRVEPADFLRVLRRRAAEQAERGLDPHGARFHEIHEELELPCRLVVAVQGLQSIAALFPQHNSRVHVERTCRQQSLQGICRGRHRSFGLQLDHVAVHNRDGIQQAHAARRLILRAGHLGIGDLLGQGFRSRLHRTQPADRSKCGIAVWSRCRQQLHIKALRLFLLFILF